MVTSDRVLVFSMATAATSASASSTSSSTSSSDASVSSKFSSRHLLTVSHNDIISAKHVVDRQLQQQQQRQQQPYFYPPQQDKHYVEILVRQVDPASSSSSPGSDVPAPVKRPQVRCDSEKVAKTVARQINYARTMYEERTQAVPDGRGGDASDQED